MTSYASTDKPIKVTPSKRQCPRCRQLTEMREHGEITEQMLRQRHYYRRWFVCTNPDCKTKDIKWPEDRVFPDKEPVT